MGIYPHIYDADCRSFMKSGSDGLLPKEHWCLVITPTGRGRLAKVNKLLLSTNNSNFEGKNFPLVTVVTNGGRPSLLQLPKWFALQLLPNWAGPIVPWLWPLLLTLGRCVVVALARILLSVEIIVVLFVGLEVPLDLKLLVLP